MCCACNPPPDSPTVSDTLGRPGAGRGNAAQQPVEPRAAESPAADGPAIAEVNGRPISREWLSAALIQTHGLTLLLQRIALEEVRQEAARAGVSATAAEIDDEYDLTLKLAEPRGEPLTPQRRKQLIEQWRLSRGVSDDELHIAMERQALLRRLAEQRLTINEQQLRDEFSRLYGAKVECRHIVLAGLRDVDRIRAMIEAGEEFETLARRHSLNDITATNDGLLPPFSQRDETVPGVLREAAFRMSPGQVSNAIQVDGQYHLLKLEKRLPPETIRFEDVRGAVERSLRERLLPIEMDKLFAELQRKANLKILDPVLSRQYEEGRREGRITGPALMRP
ncbi:MAG: peptidylprolyl isomerase [Phycisphaerae bacterium]|nr:peptidylprolyl isomerase [Phycisphaerae bacterium]NUQ47641.1 peptidylprolyl isomerase [Phycisphaerae bacterium]